MPIVCSICEAVIKADIEQGAKDKPICKDCFFIELPKALAFVKTHNESIVKVVKK